MPTVETVINIGQMITYALKTWNSKYIEVLITNIEPSEYYEEDATLVSMKNNTMFPVIYPIS